MVSKNKKEIEENSEKEENSEEKEKTTEAKLKETEDKLLRTLAEVENQRRRFEKETKDAFEFGGFNFARETLGLLDNLQRAKISIKNDETLKQSKDLDKFIKNIEILEKDLVSIFEKNNIKKIKCIDEKFDPNLHQAMLEIENSEKEPGIVIQEIQPGYMFGERLLRPSFVGVSKKKNMKKDNKN
jgi:molecular chaperone GrpE|tara:strand:+ start:185 stop:739 length:555 start_codon:yes stop_codon:yes gene_type:complete